MAHVHQDPDEDETLKGICRLVALSRIRDTRKPRLEIPKEMAHGAEKQMKHRLMAHISIEKPLRWEGFCGIASESRACSIHRPPSCHISLWSICQSAAEFSKEDYGREKNSSETRI
jgi:hypothetical protein